MAGRSLQGLQRTQRDKKNSCWLILGRAAIDGTEGKLVHRGIIDREKGGGGARGMETSARFQNLRLSRTESDTSKTVFAAYPCTSSRLMTI